jgi:hypothetical protein
MMIKSSPNPLKPFMPDPCTVTWSGSGQRPCQNYMKSSSSLANRRSCTSTRSSSNEKSPSTMKLRGHLITTREATPSKCTVSTLTVVGCRRIGIRVLDPLRKKEAKALFSKGQTSIISEEPHQAEALTHTHTSHHIPCIMAAKPITTQKIAPYFLSPKGKWCKTPNNLHSNHPLER